MGKMLPITTLFAAILIWALAHGESNSRSSSRPDVSFASEWRVFGPLPLGGVGADALSSLRTSIFSALSSLVTFPSETAKGGYAKWSTVISNVTTGIASVSFNGSAPPLSLWAVGTLNAAAYRQKFVLLHCTHRAYISPKSMNSTVPPVKHDCLGNGHPCALVLSAQVYKIYLRISSYDADADFGCAVDAGVKEPSLLAQEDIVRPSVILYRDRVILAGSHSAVTVYNADVTHWAVAGSLTLRSSPPGLQMGIHSPHPPRLAPGQTRSVRLDLNAGAMRAHSLTAGGTINVTVELTYEIAHTQRSATFNLSLAVLTWPPEVYDATYIDLDGTVQAVALRPPRGDCRTTGGCAALLSTHGAGVDALGDAWTGAYATQRGGWVLLPTGRSPYGENWEGAQMASALRCLEAVVDDLPGVPEAMRPSMSIRKHWVLISGHSMGGHGALTLATHFPDLLVAAMPIAGWLRYDTYGAVGPGFHPQLSFSDSALRGLFELSTSEYAADFYSENVLGIPFTARVGSDDQNVPPTNLRKFCRLLREYELYNNISNSFVTLNEVPGKGHWFSGVMDDGTLQPYLASALTATSKPRLPTSFSIFTINPATTGSRGGLRVLQLHTPFESARINVIIDQSSPAMWKLNTRNVARFRFQAVNGVYPRPRKLHVDANSYALTIPRSLVSQNGTSAVYQDFCRKPSTRRHPDTLKWVLCRDAVFPSPRSLERGPDTSGPLTQVISGRRVSIIYPDSHKELLGIAVRYANALQSKGLGASVKPDSTAKQVVEQGTENLVILGGGGVNAIATTLQKMGLSADVRTELGSICVGGRCTTRAGAGITFLAPGRQRRLVVVVAGTDMDGLGSACSFLPLSPEQKTPEWVIVQSGDGFGWRGYGAVEAAGYWDREWHVDRARTYPAEWVPSLPLPPQARWERKLLLLIALVAVAYAIARLSMGPTTHTPKVTKNESEEGSPFLGDEVRLGALASESQ